MPRAFDQYEQTQINQRLRDVARHLFAGAGVAKTSVEQLTTAAAIAKGSFYKFYPSKELLFMELLEQTQNEIRLPILKARTVTRKAFANRLRKMFTAICNDPLVQLMGHEAELQAIKRRVPADYLLAHQQQDQLFLEQLIQCWNTRSAAPHRDVVAARMTVLVLLSLNQAFIGDRLFPHAVTAAVTSLSNCFFDS